MAPSSALDVMYLVGSRMRNNRRHVLYSEGIKVEISEMRGT
jgi:hypothetical protein